MTAAKGGGAVGAKRSQKDARNRIRDEEAGVSGKNGAARRYSVVRFLETSLQSEVLKDDSHGWSPKRLALAWGDRPHFHADPCVAFRDGGRRLRPAFAAY